LIAFVVVCVGVVVLRYTRPDLPRPFRVPAVGLVAALGILMCGAMTAFLPWDTWLRLIVWTAIGIVVYFGYSFKHSRLRAGDSTPASSAPEST